MAEYKEAPADAPLGVKFMTWLDSRFPATQPKVSGENLIRMTFGHEQSGASGKLNSPTRGGAAR